MQCTRAKETFRWRICKKGKHVVNVCRHVALYSGAAAGIMTASMGSVLANPEGGNVVGGSATITSTTNEVRINQHSDRALIEWSSFNISKGETTRFIQPNSSSIALNRVVNSSQLSTINGNLIANGRVVVMNPNGVLIGADGNIDTAGFIATSAGIDDDAFMNAGNVLDFNRAGNIDAAVENRGNISVGEAGLAALVAPTVRNSGIIQGNLAKVQLAAADTFAVDFYGDGLISYEVDSSQGARTITTENTGEIFADGGQVLMTAAAASDVVDSVINSDGYVQAASLEKRSGKIVLTGAGATVKVSGKMDVSGQGDADGGEILIGGDFQGQGDVSKAANVDVTETAELYADAGDNGEGGKIVVWSEAKTRSRGKYFARGGSESGNGGLIETSSADLLDVDGTLVNTLAPNGSAGYWLLDPDVINLNASGVPYTPLPGTGTSNVDVNTINAALSNVILQANSDVNFNADVNIAASGVGLTVIAGVQGVGIDIPDITAPNVGLITELEAGTGTINFVNQFIRTEGGDVTFYSGNSITQNNATIFTNGGDITMISGDIGINNNAALGTEGGNVLLRAIAAGTGPNRTSGDVNTNSSFIDTTDPGAPGIGGITLTENGSPLPQSSYGNPQNVFVETDNGGTITIEGKTIGGNSVCFAAGGTGCLVPDPVAVDIVVTIDDKLKIYGALDPTFTWGITSGTLDPGDVLSVDLARILGELVGNYDIFQTSHMVTGSGLYNISFINGNLQIVPADIVLKAVDQTKTYGDTFTFNGTEYVIDSGQLFFSDNITSVDLASVGTPATANVGAYAINASNATGTGLSNYNISYLPGTLTVDPKALTITADNQTKTYGDFFGFAGTEFTTSGLVNSDSVTSVSLTSAGSPVTANVGNYAINGSAATGTGLSNYTITYVDGTLAVTPAALTVTANNQSKTYGDTFTFTGSEFTTSGLKNSDTVTNVTLASLGAPNTANVGSYTITGSNAAGTGLSNYTINYVDGTFTVNPAALTVTANNDSKVYDATAYSGGNGVTYSGFVNGENDSVLGGTLSYGGTSQGAMNVGSYVIAPSGLTSGNYTISYVNGQLQITPAALTITANNQSKTYGDTFTFTGNEFTTSGLVGGQTIGSALLSSAGSVNTAGVAGSPYTINISNASGGTADLNNYSVTYQNGSMTVNKALITVTADDKSMTYGGVFPTLTESYSGFVNGENSSVIDTLATTVSGTASTADAGFYDDTLTSSGAADDNYTFTYMPGDLTINKADLTVTALNDSKVYDSLAYSGGNGVNIVGFVNGDNVGDLGGLLGYSGTSQGATNVGGYVITPGGYTSGNYNIGYVDGSLNITPAALTVIASDQSKTYGDTFTFTGNEFTTSGLVGGETLITATLSSLGSSATANVAGSPYTINISNAGGGTANLSNYSVTYQNGAMTVNPAALSVTANNQSKVYGTTFTFVGDEFTTSGLVNGETLTTAVLSSAGSAPTAGVLGSPYDINVSNASGGTADLNNYSVTYVDGKMTVNPAALTVTANNDIKIYDSNPYSGGNGVSYSGFVNGENETTSDLIGTIAFGGNSQGAVNVGNYVISANGLNSDNYIISYVDGQLSLIPRRIIVAADNQMKIYGDADPALTYQALGLVGGDTVGSVFTGSLDRTVGENVGLYTINPGTLSVVNNNYVYAFKAAGLQIKPAPLVITANDDTKIADGVPYSGGNGVSYSGFKFNDDPSVLYFGTPITYSGSSQGAVDPGSYVIDPSAKVKARNYTITFMPGTLDITPAPFPFVEIDPLGRPIISVANQAIVLDEPFEEIETLELSTDVGISSSGTTAESLAGISPAAGEEPSAEDLASLEPAAGGESEQDDAQDQDEFSRDIACANGFLDDNPCDENEI